MTKYKKTVIETKNKLIKYQLTDDIVYSISYENDIEISRTLHYIGDNILGYKPFPIFKKDISGLESMNPFHDNYWWFDKEDEDYTLPDIDDINIIDIYLVCNSSHMIFRSDKTIVPIVENIGYINYGLDDYNYDLTRLKEKLESNENILSISEEDIPFYNRLDGSTKYLDLIILPTQEQMDLLYLFQDFNIGDILFPKKYHKELYEKDILGINSFRKRR